MPRSTGQHVSDETLVAGHVDEADLLAVWQREVGEAEIDRNPAKLFFGQTVGVDAGESPDQRGFAMIDVARGSDNDSAASVHITI